MDDGLSLALVGDVIHTRQLASTVARDPAFAQTIDRLRAADAAIGNLEITVAERDDPDAWVWSIPQDWSMAAEPHVIADLHELGFSAVGRANNHAMDRGPAGLRTTSRLLDAAGIVHAGTGEHLARARAPRFLETAAGRLGIVSVTTNPTPRHVAPALDAFAGLAARPGVHALPLQPVVTVPPAAHAALRDVHDGMSDAMGEWMSGQEGLHLFDATFEPGDRVVVRYDVDAEARAGLLLAVRHARQQADAAVLLVHAHQGDHDPSDPPAFLRELAHDAIEAGADVVAVSGPHVLAPVELHEGHPILYGLGNFVWSDVLGPLPGYFWQLTRRVLGEEIDPATMTEAELVARLNDDGFADPWVFRAVLAQVTLGADVRVQLYPVDLGMGLPVARRGVPRAATPDVAREIVDRLAKLSAPFGVEVTDADGVGVVAAS